jgi:hypothetical protein
MAFNIDRAGTTFTGKVEFSYPIGDGKQEHGSFTAIFERGHQTEIENMREEFRAYIAIIRAIELGSLEPSAADGLERKSLLPIAEKILVGWGEDMLEGDNDNPKPFTAENKKKVIEFPGVANALVSAWNTLTDPEVGKPPTSGKSRGNGIGK